MYGTQIVEEDYIRLRQGNGLLTDRNDYRKNPDKYRSVFHERVRLLARQRSLGPVRISSHALPY